MKIVIAITLMLYCSQLLSDELGATMIGDNLRHHPLGMREAQVDFNAIIQKKNLSAFKYNQLFNNTTYRIPTYRIPNKLLGFKNKKLVFPEHIPDGKRSEIKNLHDKIRGLCPECSQAPIIVTENPITVFSEISESQPFSGCHPKCSEGMQFDTEQAICIKECPAAVSPGINTCDIPIWFESGISGLEVVAKHYAVELNSTEKFCKRTYILSLIEQIKETVK